MLVAAIHLRALCQIKVRLADGKEEANAWTKVIT